MDGKPTGRYIDISVTGEAARAFLPDPLPPRLEPSGELKKLRDEALHALGGLSAAAPFFPDRDLLLYLYVRKEAVLSSQIEGTQSSLSDLLLFEQETLAGVPLDDVEEVSSYVAALNHGVERLQSGMPVSNRLIREIHEILLATGRGADKAPGEFRRSQNWVGGSSPSRAFHVPPPPEHVQDCMGDLERFIHSDYARSDPIFAAALAHVQFETIHPFLDGNGRVGRLLVTLMLVEAEILKSPILYLSLYFKSHRDEYYRLLNGVRQSSGWEAWLEFFSIAVRDTSRQAIEGARRVAERVKKDREAILTLGRTAPTTLMVFERFRLNLVHTIGRIHDATGLSHNTVTAALAGLERLGIVREMTGKKRDRVYAYSPLLDILNEGTEPL